jgi:antagonist of KipI
MICIDSPGALTTVQDLGRPGHGLAGVSRAGAADPVALRLGNRLLGNAESAPALEMTLLAGRFTFPDGAMVAITGSDCAPHPSWTPVRIDPGQTLRLGPMAPGCRSYLCVRGGIVVPLFAGSASTHVAGGLGGYEGRALRKGDQLRIGPEPVDPVRRGIRPEVLAALKPRTLLRVTLGPQADWFQPESVAAFFASTYRVGNDSNRLGIRLEGPAVARAGSREMATEGVPLGAIQITAGGQPIILFVDQQTTGGYPKVANVATVDLPSVGQLKPGDLVQFVLIEAAEARRLLLEREALLRSEEIFL